MNEAKRKKIREIEILQPKIQSHKAPVSFVWKILKVATAFVSIPFVFSFLMFWVFSGVGLVWQFVSTKKYDSYKNRKPKDLKVIDVGGLKLGFRDVGKPDGTPFVFVPGLGVCVVTPFKYLADTLAEKHNYRVFMYDKAGLGVSEETQPGSPYEKRVASTMAEELHELIHKHKFPTPFIMCAGSMGGLIAQMYYYKYPEDISGMAFIDPSTEDFYRKASKNRVKGLRMASKIYRFATVLSYFGIIRMLFRLRLLPEELSALLELPMGHIIAEEMSLPKTLKIMAYEFDHFEESCDEVRKKRQANPRINVPIGVITARNQFGLTEEEKESWISQQHVNVATLSDDWIHIVHTDASHGSLMTHTDEIIKIVNLVRDEVENKKQEM